MFLTGNQYIAQLQGPVVHIPSSVYGATLMLVRSRMQIVAQIMDKFVTR